MLKRISIGIAVLALFGSPGAFASCADLSKAFFGVEMAGPRNYLEVTPEGFRVSTILHASIAGGRDTLRGDSHDISHVANLDFWRDERVMRIEDSVLTSFRKPLERNLEIISEITGIPFETDPSGNFYTLACESELSVIVCEEKFPVAPRSHMILVIEHALNDAMYRDALVRPDGSSAPPAPNAGRGDGPICRPMPPDAVPERGPVFESSLSPAEIEIELQALRERLVVADASEDVVLGRLNRARSHFSTTPTAYKTAEKLALFPEISESDELASYCEARFVIPPVHEIYVSPREGEPDAVDVKTMGCRVSEGEMYCTLSVDNALAVEQPENFFFIDGSVDRAEALTVASLYLEKTGSWKDLNRISKQGDDYILQFGRRGCACSETRHARIVEVSGETVLEMDEPIERVCA